MGQFPVRVSTGMQLRDIFGMEEKKPGTRWNEVDTDQTSRAALPGIANQDEFYAGT